MHSSKEGPVDRHLCVEDSCRKSKSQSKLKGEIKNDPILGGRARPTEVGVSALGGIRAYNLCFL
jgi:hypothetical protein